MMCVCLSYTWLHYNGDNCIVFEISRHQWCDDTTSCIRHLASERLLSLISKENIHINVRQLRDNCIVFENFKEWCDIALDLLCQTTLSWRHIIGMRGKTHQYKQCKENIHINVRQLRDNCIVFENFTASIRDLMVAKWVYWRRVSGASKRIFAIFFYFSWLRLCHLVNNTEIYIYDVCMSILHMITLEWR
jgi:DNA polymerase III epsilon subunit-like protein